MSERPQVVAGEWQPIDTAPKDGSTVKARQGKWAPYHARWKDGEWQPVEYNGSHYPTHWLPEPPVTA